VLENNIHNVVVAGGGHAGVEAALAVSRLGVPCTIVTLDGSALGRLSCNPAIGGLGKSHLVKEIDALGGYMGRCADLSGIQFKTLNKTKGRAVWALRAQIDKKTYPKFIKKEISKNKNISLIEDEVVGFSSKKNVLCSVKLKKRGKINCSALIITSGTFLNGLIHIGKQTFAAGRLGEKPAKGLSESLINHGFVLGRLKTGTPPRLAKDSINWEHTKKAPGDIPSPSFSLFTKRPFKHLNESCFSVNTNKDVHTVINNNLYNSPMFSGKIKATGPRYCPSIEDKVYKFKERSSHLLFLEPEWSNSSQIYLNGFSTSLPANTQLAALRKIKAFNNVIIRRPGYAIEYDYCPPYQLKNSLESKLVSGLFLAGQINGTSGYEEAAAQGLMAGTNAALYFLNKPSFILDRSVSYIGVMIQDLITSHLKEPYRMFTSRAENRLYLRADNVYHRLSPLAKKVGLLSSSHTKKLSLFFDSCDFVRASSKNSFVVDKNKKITVEDFVRRPEASLFSLLPTIPSSLPFYNWSLFFVETCIKYKGYIKNESDRVLKMKKNLKKPFPKNFDFSLVSGLSKESIEKLTIVSPSNLYQASLVDGVRPTDLLVLNLYLSKPVSRET